MAAARLGLFHRYAAVRLPSVAPVSRLSVRFASSSATARSPSTSASSSSSVSIGKGMSPAATASSAQKQRRLQTPVPAGWIDDKSIGDAITSLELRKMPIVRNDINWLRQAKGRLVEIVRAKEELYKAQNKSSQRMADIIAEQKGLGASLRKEAKKEKKKAKKAADRARAEVQASSTVAEGPVEVQTGANLGAAADASTQEVPPSLPAEAQSREPVSLPEEVTPQEPTSSLESEEDATPQDAETQQPSCLSPEDNASREVPAAGTGEADAAASEASTKAKLDEEMADLRRMAKKLKVDIAGLESEEEEIRQRSLRIRLGWPNDLHPEVPVGPEAKAIVAKVWDGEYKLPQEYKALRKRSWDASVVQLEDFPAGPKPDPSRDHLNLSSKLLHGQIDMAAGVLSTGSSWPYLLGTVSLLEQALAQYALSAAVRSGFVPVTPPDVIRTELADRCGFQPRDEKAKQTYFLESDKPTSGGPIGNVKDASDLCLAATAEIPLAGLLAGVTFPASTVYEAGDLVGRSRLPIKLVALGHAFRAEAGARGADTRGLYRVHQFTKVEMFVATEGSGAKSNKMLEALRGIQEDVIFGLGLPYRVLDMPTEELGASAYRKYDIEVWMPGRGSWGEVSSASNCTDYQSRRLRIRYQKQNAAAGSATEETSADTNGKKMRYAHTLNATAAAIPRLVVALIENYGVRRGKLVLPSTLKPFWLGHAAHVPVVWVETVTANKATIEPKPETEGKIASALQRAIQKVQETARRSGTDPASMMASFLILHELTAIVPVVLLFYLLSALGAGEAVLLWLQQSEGEAELGTELKNGGDADISFIGGYVRGWINEGMLRAERYGRKKGYFGFEKEADPDVVGAPGEVSIVNAVTSAAAEAESGAGAGPTEAALVQRMQLAGSFANAVAAYALVKALLPLRIGASIALAGPFSRFLFEPLKRLGRKVLARRPATPPPPGRNGHAGQ